MDEAKRAGEELDVDEIGKTFGTKDPAAYEYGLDHAMRNGYIKVDPASGKRTIRRDYLGKTMSHLDSAEGVKEISKRNITLIQGQLAQITDPAQRKPLEDRLLIEQQHNAGAMKWLELQENAKQKGLDREAHEKVARINKAPQAETASQVEYRKAITDKTRAETDILKQGGKLSDDAYKDLAKYMTSDQVAEELRLVKDPNMREMRRQELEDRFLQTRTGKRQLGGGPASAGGDAAAPVPGARKGRDGNWYVVKDGKTYRVDK